MVVSEDVDKANVKADFKGNVGNGGVSGMISMVLAPTKLFLKQWKSMDSFERNLHETSSNL